MSACPGCGNDAIHVGAYVPKRPDLPVSIIHECRTVGCSITRFNERMERPFDEVMERWGRLSARTFQAQLPLHEVPPCA